MRADAGSSSGGGASSVNLGTGNTADGSYAISIGRLNTASASVGIAIGNSCTGSGSYGFAGGFNNTASGSNSVAMGGSCVASGVGASAIGDTSSAQGNYSTAVGSRAVARWVGSLSHASFRFAADGDAQVTDMILGIITTNATATTLTSDKSASINISAGAGINVPIITAGRAWRFTIDVAARRTDSQGPVAGWVLRGVAHRETTGIAYFPVSATSESWKSASASAWDVGVAIDITDSTNNYLKVYVTGESGATIRWVAHLRLVEVAG